MSDRGSFEEREHAHGHTGAQSNGSVAARLPQMESRVGAPGPRCVSTKLEDVVSLFLFFIFWPLKVRLLWALQRSRWVSTGPHNHIMSQRANDDAFAESIRGERVCVCGCVCAGAPYVDTHTSFTPSALPYA